MFFQEGKRRGQERAMYERNQERTRVREKEYYWRTFIMELAKKPSVYNQHRVFFHLKCMDSGLRRGCDVQFICFDRHVRFRAVFVLLVKAKQKQLSNFLQPERSE